MTRPIVGATTTTSRFFMQGGVELSRDAILNVRWWKGDDATYLNLMLDKSLYDECPLGPAKLLFQTHDGTTMTKWVVREIIMQMGVYAWQISLVDEQGWAKLAFVPGVKMPPLPDFMPKPPRFSSVEEADAWLEQHG